MAGERQSARIRSLYLNAVLRQDIAFFDTELTTGQAVSRMSSDTLVVQDALGEKVLHLFSYHMPQTQACTDLQKMQDNAVHFQQNGWRTLVFFCVC